VPATIISHYSGKLSVNALKYHNKLSKTIQRSGQKKK